MIGGFLGFVFTRINESSKVKREDRRRWDAELLNRSGAFLTAASEMWRASAKAQKAVVRMHASRELPDQSGFHALRTIALDEAKIARDQGVAFEHALQDLLLVAPESVQDAALALAESFDPQSAKYSSPSSELRTSLIDAVRSHVGVPERT